MNNSKTTVEAHDRMLEDFIAEALFETAKEIVKSENPQKKDEPEIRIIKKAS